MRIEAEAAAAEARKAAEASDSHKKAYQRLCNNTKKKLARAITSKLRLQAELKAVKTISTQNSTQHIRETRILMQRISNYKSELQRVKVVLRETRLLLKATRRKLRHMRIAHLKLKQGMECRVRACLHKLSGQRLYMKGKFTKEARRLMCT
jgi:hypothetical protein